MLILLTAFHKLHIFEVSLTEFQNFPGLVAFLQDWKVLENAITKFQDFPGFPGPVRTLIYVYWYILQTQHNTNWLTCVNILSLCKIIFH